MNTQKALAKITRLGPGIYECGFCGLFSGYLHIDKSKDGFHVMWMSGKTSHNALWGPAISVEYKHDGSIGFVGKSAFSMWPVRNQNEIEYLTDKISEKIKKLNPSPY